MTIATGVILGLIIITAGSALTWLSGLTLLGLSKNLSSAAKLTKKRAVLSWIAGPVGLLTLVAGPLASLWAGIATFVHFLGV